MSSRALGSRTRGDGAPLQADARRQGSEAGTGLSGTSQRQLPGMPELHDMPMSCEAVDNRYEQPLHASGPL